MRSDRKVLLLGQRSDRLVQLREQLEPAGLKIFIAHSDETAISLFRDYRFSAVIVDLNGMEETGLKVGERIHSEERSPATPVFFLGGASMLIERVKATYRAGNVEFMKLNDSSESIARKVDQYCDAEDQSTDALSSYAGLSASSLRDFCIALAHDLHEPLRGIHCYAELLWQSGRSKLTPDELHLLETMTTSVERSIDLLEGLQQLIKANDGDAVARGPVDCEVIVQRALSLLQVAVEENDACVVVDPLPTLESNGALLLQVFQNLISNALKYRSASRPQIRISCEAQPEEWCFAVSDNGIGIQQVFLEYIFRPLKRLSGKGSHGAGLGLAVCRNALERLDGKIWAHSCPGKGSTFYFTLPRPSADRPH